CGYRARCKRDWFGCSDGARAGLAMDLDWCFCRGFITAGDAIASLARQEMRTAVRVIACSGPHASHRDRNGMRLAGHHFVADEIDLHDLAGEAPSMGFFGFDYRGCCMGGHSILGDHL